MKVTILGLSITSSWGNGHATNYRALARALCEHGDEVTFLERDVPWYAANRDLRQPPWGETHLYDSVDQLRSRFEPVLREADLVIVGSFVPDGVDVARWARSAADGALAFYDIDTPVTVAKLRAADAEYLTPDLVEQFDLYLSFTGGPLLDVLREEFGARRPTAFYCFVDERAYTPAAVPQRWVLNYLGTYAAGRQPAVEELLLEPARMRPGQRFALAGPMYPPDIRWPENLDRIEHLPPAEHPAFYCGARFTLNLTRPEMRGVGFSPSVRLFEAAACGVPVMSDRWPGIETLFEPGREILLVDGAADVIEILSDEDPVGRETIGQAARRRVLSEHTASRRIQQLHDLMREPVAQPLP